MLRVSTGVHGSRTLASIHTSWIGYIMHRNVNWPAIMQKYYVILVKCECCGYSYINISDKLNTAALIHDSTDFVRVHLEPDF